MLTNLIVALILQTPEEEIRELYKPGRCKLGIEFASKGRIFITVENDSDRAVYVQPISFSTYFLHCRSPKGEERYAQVPESVHHAPPVGFYNKTQVFPTNVLSASVPIPAKYRKPGFEYSVHYWGGDLNPKIYCGLSSTSTKWFKPPPGWLGGK